MPSRNGRAAQTAGVEAALPSPPATAWGDRSRLEHGPDHRQHARKPRFRIARWRAAAARETPRSTCRLPGQQVTWRRLKAGTRASPGRTPAQGRERATHGDLISTAPTEQQRRHCRRPGAMLQQGTLATGAEPAGLAGYAPRSRGLAAHRHPPRASGFSIRDTGRSIDSWRTRHGPAARWASVTRRPGANDGRRSAGSSRTRCSSTGPGRLRLRAGQLSDQPRLYTVAHQPPCRVSQHWLSMIKKAFAAWCCEIAEAHRGNAPWPAEAYAPTAPHAPPAPSAGLRRIQTEVDRAGRWLPSAHSDGAPYRRRADQSAAGKVLERRSPVGELGTEFRRPAGACAWARGRRRPRQPGGPPCLAAIAQGSEARGPEGHEPTSSAAVRRFRLLHRYPTDPSSPTSCTGEPTSKRAGWFTEAAGPAGGSDELRRRGGLRLSVIACSSRAARSRSWAAGQVSRTAGSS